MRISFSRVCAFGLVVVVSCASVSGQKTEQLVKQKIEFLYEQVGSNENSLKISLAEAFKDHADIKRTYLVRVDYGNPDSYDVALCLKVSGGKEEEIARSLGSVFEKLAPTGAHMDILFLTDEQEADVLLVAEPFYGQDTESLTLPGEVRLNQRQPPDTVLKTIGIKPGMIIGEVGAGRGRYTVQIAARIRPDGMIYANDIQQDALEFLKKRCKEHGLTNVKTILSTVTDPKLPKAALDMVIMVNVVHCLDKPVELFKNLSACLKPEGIIVIVEGNLDKDSSAANEWYARSKVLRIYEDAGYVLFREETFLPKDNIYFLKRAESGKQDSSGTADAE